VGLRIDRNFDDRKILAADVALSTSCATGYAGYASANEGGNFKQTAADPIQCA